MFVSTPRLTAEVGSPYVYDADGRAEATGTAPIVYSVVAVTRPGFMIDAASGLVSWTPGAAGSVDVTLQASNAAGIDTQSFTVDVSAAGTPPAITSVAGTNGRIREPYAYDADGAAQADGTPPLAWSLPLGPAGMSIDPGTGSVAWTPTEAGSFPVTIAVANAFGSDQQSFVVEVAGDPPGVVTPANLTSITYCPSERLALGPPRPEQHLNVFLPTGVAPPGGWPTVLVNSTGGGYAVPPLTEIRDTGNTRLLYELLAAGIACVHHGNTGVGGGNGMFYPPGHPSGRYESPAPADDNPFKEAEWVVQWAKTQADYDLDPTRLGVLGSSQGAMILAWATLGPDRARPSGSDQATASTRVRAACLVRLPSSIWALDQTPTLGSMVIGQFEQAAAPGVPADFLAQVDEELQKDASALRFLFETAEARENNRRQPVCLVYDEPVLHVSGQPASLEADAEGFPLLHDAIAPPFIHDTWFGHALFRRFLGLGQGASNFHRASSVFTVRDTVALPSPWDTHTGTFVGPFDGADAGGQVRDWLIGTL